MKWFNILVIGIFIGLMVFITFVGQNHEALSEQEKHFYSRLHNVSIQGVKDVDIDMDLEEFQDQEGFGGGESVSQAGFVNESPLTYQGDDEDEPNIEAKVALVWDIESGQELYQKNSTERYQLASITKLLTATVVLDKYTYGSGEWVTMSQSAFDTYGGKSLLVGESFTVEDLIKAILLPSSNPSATLLAEHFGHGDYDQFINDMNQKAQEIGMKSSYFQNPHGLDEDNHYSTARDVQKLTEYVYENYPFLLEMMSQEQTTIRTSEGREILIRNSNELISDMESMYAGKTGFTYDALETLTSIIEINGRKIGVTVMQSPIGGYRFLDTKQIAYWIEENYMTKEQEL